MNQDVQLNRSVDSTEYEHQTIIEQQVDGLQQLTDAALRALNDEVNEAKQDRIIDMELIQQNQIRKQKSFTTLSEKHN
jgi:hypothetical protein